MNYNLYLVLFVAAFFLLLSSSNVVFAETSFRGSNYLQTNLGKDVFGNDIIKTELGLPNRLDSGNNNFNNPYILTETNDSIKVESGTGSFIFNKTTCSLNVYDADFILQNSIPDIGSDSFLMYGAVLNTSNWINLTSINNAQCQTSIIQDGQNIEVQALKEVPGQGKVLFRYVKNADAALKLQIEPTNLNSSWTNHKLGIKQIIEVPNDITLGDTVYHLPNYNGTNLSRQWLVNHKEVLLNYPLIKMNKTLYNFDLGWQYLESVDILYQNGKSKLILNYFNNNIKISPGQTLVIDPTYSSTNPTEDGGVGDSSNNDVCDTAGSTFRDSAGNTLQANGYENSNGTDCIMSYLDYDTTSINDLAVIQSVVFKHEITTVSSSTGCSYIDLDTVRYSSSVSTIISKLLSGTVFTTSSCSSTGLNTVTLGSFANYQVQHKLTSNYFSFGFRQSNTALDATRHQVDSGSEENGATTKPTLEITYIVPSSPRFTLTTSNEKVGDMIKLNGTLRITDGYNVNKTEIKFYQNGTLLNTNSTFQNTTTYPYSIHFGPFYKLLSTGSVYNFTFTAKVQDYTNALFSNITKTYQTREYDPNYFEADDPTQGNVNYTFPGDGFIHINREKNGTTFDVECQLFTQSQAFFNNLTAGDWNNKSNVYYYNEDVGDFYYMTCYNDGELFTTPIPQNFSNALVPGLVIFDQLGGFFGMPSIALVVLSILSLGTGRNYPIILLIAASVTGILLALQLLTLDPGLILVLIVLSGIGIFGIRKFY